MEDKTCSPEHIDSIENWCDYLTKLYCQPRPSKNGQIWVEYKGIPLIIKFKDTHIEFECLVLLTLNLNKPLDRKSFYEATRFLCYSPGPRLVIHEPMEDNEQIISGYYYLFSNFIFEEKYEDQNLTALRRILDSFYEMRMKLLLEMQYIKEETSDFN